MISWIQNHLIRHGRWIFLTLLGVIIVAFVFTIGNTPGCTSDQSAYTPVDFYGYDLNSQRDIDAIAQRTSLSAMLSGQQIRGEQQFQSEVMARIAILAQADKLNLPAPTKDVLTDYIKTKPAFRGAEGTFSADAYTRFVDGIESNPQIPQGLVIQTLEEDYKIEQIRDVLAGPGYVLPSEAKVQVQTNQTTLSLSTAQFAYADFAPEITAGDETLKAYYAANSIRYEIPERIKASYLTFKTADYIDQIEETDEAEQRTHFIANRARFVAEYTARQTAPKESTDATSVTFEDVKTAVSTDLRKAQAKRLANEAAQSFAYKLYAEEVKRESAAFNKLLNENGLKLKPIEPYTASGAAQRALSTEMLRSAFALNDSRYYSDAYAIGDDFAVLIYEGRIDPLIPEFEAVADEVAADYTSTEKRRLFNENGASLQAKLETALSEGTAFTEAAESLDLTIQSYEAFKVGEAPEGLSPSIVQQAIGLKSGSVSPMVQTGGIGTFIYLDSKEIPEISTEDSQVVESSQFLSQLTSYLSANSLANELVVTGLPDETAE